MIPQARSVGALGTIELGQGASARLPGRSLARPRSDLAPPHPEIVVTDGPVLAKVGNRLSALAQAKVERAAPDTPLQLDGSRYGIQILRHESWPAMVDGGGAWAEELGWAELAAPLDGALGPGTAG